MNVRLVKQKPQYTEKPPCSDPKPEPQPDENQVRNAVQDWIKEFKSRKAEAARINFRQPSSEN